MYQRKIEEKIVKPNNKHNRKTETDLHILTPTHLSLNAHTHEAEGGGYKGKIKSVKL